MYCHHERLLGREQKEEEEEKEEREMVAIVKPENHWPWKANLKKPGVFKSPLVLTPTQNLTAGTEAAGGNCYIVRARASTLACVCALVETNHSPPYF